MGAETLGSFQYAGAEGFKAMVAALNPEQIAPRHYAWRDAHYRPDLPLDVWLTELLSVIQDQIDQPPVYASNAHVAAFSRWREEILSLPQQTPLQVYEAAPPECLHWMGF